MFSADEAGGTRFKMERFLHPGRAGVATVYGPIAFGPLPLLAFQRCAGGGLRLAAAGERCHQSPQLLGFPQWVA